MTQLYRVENPNIPAAPNGVTSDERLVGQWFSTNVDDALKYLAKSTQTFGVGAKAVDGAALVIADVPAKQLAAYRAQAHPVAAEMDIEPGNYIIPRDGSVPTEVVPLDEAVGELRGQLNKFDKFTEAKKRILTQIGRTASR